MGVIINQLINKRKCEETLSFLILLICPFIHLTCIYTEGLLCARH